MTIGYDSFGVKYLKALTNTNILFERGVFKTGDSSVT